MGQNEAGGLGTGQLQQYKRGRIQLQWVRYEAAVFLFLRQGVITLVVFSPIHIRQVFFFLHPCLCDMFFVFMGSVVQYTAGGTQELSLVTAPPPAPTPHHHPCGI